jgi:hypothetical protein
MARIVVTFFVAIEKKKKAIAIINYHRLLRCNKTKKRREGAYLQAPAPAY